MNRERQHSSFAPKPTPPQEEGPFYPTTLPPEQDNDLVRVGEGQQAMGTVTYISGHVLDPAGRPLAEAVVEIWQCDHQGLYFHPRHRDRRDPAFQGFGTTMVTGKDGFYQFRTIRPVSYANRAPHIHFKVRGTAFDEVTTQIYVEGEPHNGQDSILNSITVPTERTRLLVPLQPAPQHEPNAPAGHFDLVLGYETQKV